MMFLCPLPVIKTSFLNHFKQSNTIKLIVNYCMSDTLITTPNESNVKIWCIVITPPKTFFARYLCRTINHPTSGFLTIVPHSTGS